MIDDIQYALEGPLGDYIAIGALGIGALYAVSYLATVVAAFTPGDADDLAMGKVMDKLMGLIDLFLPFRGKK